MRLRKVDGYGPGGAEECQAREAFSAGIVERYREGVTAALRRNYRVRHVSLLGSFGRLDATPESDMDPWVVCDEGATLGELAALSDEELRLRATLADGHGLPNLARHRASVFTAREGALYRRAFLSRVEIPRQLGGHREVLRADGAGLEDVPYSYHERLADTVVSVEEFAAQFRRCLGAGDARPQSRRKWGRRIAQEVHFLRTGDWVARNHGLDALIAERYAGDDLGPLAEADRFTAATRGLIDEGLLAGRRLGHHLMWTLEKVRWELFQAVSGRDRLEEWRHSRGGRLGFTPPEVGDLVVRVMTALGGAVAASHELCQELVRLTRSEYPGDRLPAFHESLSRWLCENAGTLLGDPGRLEGQPVSPRSHVVPRIAGGERVLTRVGLGPAARFVRSEFLALRAAEPERVVSASDTPDCSVVDVRDLGGRPLRPEEVDAALPEYARLLRELHGRRLDSFGRLGEVRRFRYYGDYLAFRVGSSRLPEAHRVRLQEAIGQHRDALDAVEPALCHMDPGVRNLVLDGGGTLRLVDWEHASGCAAEWDVQRVLMGLTDAQRTGFLAGYLQGQEPESAVSRITAAVMRSLFLANLGAEWESQLHEALALLGD